MSNSECSEMTPCGTIIIRTIAEGQIEAWRIEKERERNPDRFSLDKSVFFPRIFIYKYYYKFVHEKPELNCLKPC